MKKSRSTPLPQLASLRIIRSWCCYLGVRGGPSGHSYWPNDHEIQHSQFIHVILSCHLKGQGKAFFPSRPLTPTAPPIHPPTCMWRNTISPSAKPLEFTCWIQRGRLENLKKLRGNRSNSRLLPGATGTARRVGGGMCGVCVGGGKK
jgi:hypothetical protein